MSLIIALAYVNVCIPFFALAHYRVTSPWTIVFYFSSSWINIQFFSIRYLARSPNRVR